MLFAKPWWDALIVLLIVLLFVGPKRLPALGKSLGQGMREFKDSITGHSSDDEDEHPALTKTSAADTDAAQTTTAPASDAQSPKVASSETRS